MAGYLIRRLLQLIPVMLGVSAIVFLLMRLTPGDPAVLMLGPGASSDAVAALRTELGLDRPLVIQYVLWLVHAVSGDLGRSIRTGLPVVQELGDALSATLLLTVSALGISSLVGISIGVLAAVNRGAWFDQLTMLIATLGVSMPAFLVGIILIVVFSVELRWLPTSGMYSPVGGGFGDLLTHLILPALTLAARATAVVARMTRSSLLGVLNQDYIRTARAKGLSRARVVLRHALSNALIPVVTVIGAQVGYLLGGAVLVETVFSWPGVGTLMLRGIATRDLPVVQGATLLAAAAFVLVNLSVDLLYPILDPRIRLGATEH